MDRRLFIASALSSPLLAGGQADGAPASDAPKKASFVPAGKDRDTEVLKIFGTVPLAIKVSTKDTDGRLLVLEHADMGKSGAFRHMHLEQDEWFYVTKGEFVFEVGDEKFRLKPGDSLFAPRKVPHVWACVSDKGTLLLALSPAGTFETYIRDLTKLTKPPTLEEAAKAFAAHGMKFVGPPLKIE
jgi:quercetin dioxygenase-like cupin family protein